MKLALLVSIHVGMTTLATAVVIANALHPIFHPVEGGAVDDALVQANALVGSWLNSNGLTRNT